jgi:hypothetical protein
VTGAATSPGTERRQISLRTIFFWMFCAAVGLTSSFGPIIYRPQRPRINNDLMPPSLEWTQVALWSATTAIAVGLARQAIAITSWKRQQPSVDRQLRFAVRFEVAWRGIVALLLASIIVIRTLAGLHFVELPEDQAMIGADVITDFLLWLLLLLVMRAGINQAQPSTAPRPERSAIAVPLWIGIVLFGAYVLIHSSFIAFLVHLGCRGVDAGLRYTGNRYPLWTDRTESFYVLRAGGLVAAWFVGTALMLQYLAPTGRSSLWRGASAILGVTLLASAGVFVWWFIFYDYARISPDFADAGTASNWYQRLGGGAVVFLLAGIGASLVSRIRGSSRHVVAPASLALPLVVESWPVISLLIGEFGYSVVRTVISFFEPDAMAFDWDVLPYILISPEVAFMAALLLFSLWLAALRRKRMIPKPVIIRAMSGWAFATAFATLLISLTIGIPLLAIFSFSFWLGPWYRW